MKNIKTGYYLFVGFLRESGFDANFDEAIMQDKAAAHLGKMMVYNIQSSDKIIIILTQGYKEKADKDIGGVGTEYGYILSEIAKMEKKYILVSFQSLNSKVIDDITPFGLKSREIIDLVDDEKKGFEKLFSKLSNQPVINLPPVAKTKPVIKEKKIPEFTLNINKNDNPQAYDYYDIYFFDTPTKFFDYRLSQAFPGVRGIQWFTDPKIIIKRLAVLLRSPLELLEKNNPIWWFRGYQSLHIDKCEFIDEEKFLMNNMECLVDRICVYKSSRYDRSFVYVEVKAEKPIGIYKHDKDYILKMMETLGYANEEYAIYKEHLITRAEYDDGAKFINNELVSLSNDEVKLRVRYLSKYNFIICALFNPINSHEADTFFEKYVNGMLDNVGNIEEIVNFVERLPRNKNGYK